jgi:hypothetical protein
VNGILGMLCRHYGFYGTDKKVLLQFNDWDLREGYNKIEF